MIIIKFTDHAKKQLKKLPKNIKKKLQKQLHLLKDNIKHPSLHLRKKANSDQYEGRIDIHYRFTGQFIDENFYITSIGMHDVGLGKK